MKIKVTYESNNSGGSWWLEDKDWGELEKAGWYVIWSGVYHCHSDFSLMEHEKYAIEKKGEPCKTDKDCKGHRICDSMKEAEDHRYLGALAKACEKEFEGENVKECVNNAMIEFEKITGQDIADEGCNCCGAPHHFDWEVKGKYNYCSGEDCLEYLYPDKKVPKSLREVLEQ